MCVAQKWAYATGTTSATVSLTNGTAPYNLTVIDSIVAAMTLGVAGDITVTIDGATIAAQIIAVEAANVSGTVKLDFSGGLPMWNASQSNLAPETSITVAVTGSGTPALAKVWVLYHYAKPSEYTT